MWSPFNFLANEAVGAAGGADSVFGTRPEVAPYVPTELEEEQKRAVSSNLSNADSIFAMLDRFVPGFSDMLRQGTSNAQSLLQGELPQDVQDAVMRSSAYRALMGGFSGTDFAHALTARDLGRTSLDLQQMGNNSAQMWTKLAQTSASPFVIDTMQQAGTTAANNAGEQASRQFQFNVDAAPDPGAAGIFNLQTALGMQAASFGMGAAGGAMGGGRTAAPTGTTATPYAYGNGSYAYNPSTGSYQLVRGPWGA